MPEDEGILGDAFEGYHEPPTTIVSPAQYAEIEAEAIRYHNGENRTQRRAAVANFKHPEADRRELLKQRQRQRRGKLDIETRKLQRKAMK
jgi:hypothetical protein